MKASIIVPVYNSKEVEDTLKSLLSQDYKDYEIIAVDDGSTDSTIEIVKKYPVKLLTQEHRGPAAARNLGARNAAGEILVFTDADCTPEKNWLLEMLRPFENPEIVGVQGRYKTRQHSLIARFAQYEIEERYERMEKHRYIDFIGSYSAAYRREIFLKESGFDESFPIASGEDPELSFRLADKGYKMVFNPNAVVYHRHPDTLLKYLRQKFYRAYWRVAMYKKNPEKIIKETYTPQLLKFQVAIFYLLILSAVTFIKTPTIPAAISLLLIVTGFPLSFEIFKKDKKTGVVSPLIIFLRNAVFGFGLIYGLLKSYTSSS